MKPILIPLFLVVFLLPGGCRKTGDNNNAVITNPTSYILKKRTISIPNSWGVTTEFFYNSRNLVSQIKSVRWNQGSVYGQPVRIWYDTTNYSFEYTNGRVSRSTFGNGPSTAYYIYEYNAAGLLFRRTTYQPYIAYDPATGGTKPDTMKRYNLYSYDNNRNLSEVIDSTNKTAFRHEFTYDGNGNMVSEIIYEVEYQMKLKSEWSDFDNKVNFVKAINGLPPTYPWDNTFFAYSCSSPGNFGVQKEYSTTRIDQSFVNTASNSYSYEYNEEALPTKMIGGNSVVTFEYQKFKRFH